MVEPAMVVASPAFADLARRACAQCETEVPLFVYDVDDTQQLPADPAAPVARAVR